MSSLKHAREKLKYKKNEVPTFYLFLSKLGATIVKRNQSRRTKS